MEEKKDKKKKSGKWFSRDSAYIFYTAMVVGPALLIYAVLGYSSDAMWRIGINMSYLQPSVWSPLMALIFSIVAFIICIGVYKNQRW